MKRQNIINRNFPLFIYVFCLLISLIVLWQGRSYGLFAMPQPGMDQHNFLDHVDKLFKGVLPDYSYKLSFLYTLFIAFLSLVTGGKLVLMRLIQICLCALMPVVIFKLCRLLRCNYISSQVAALIYCFYGPAILVSMGILRAGPLALCFISFIYLLVKGFYSKKWYHYLLAGLLAGAAVLCRENFIPVVLSPFIMLIFPLVRKHVKYHKAAIYFAGIMILVTPILIYNYVRFESPEIIPGNFANIFGYYEKKLDHSSPEKLRISTAKRVIGQGRKFVSSYEIPNSLSFYAHREFISLLNILLVPFNLILAMALTALLLDFRHLRSLFVGGMATGYFLSIIYFYMFYRYRIVDIPLLIVLSGILVDILIKAKSKRKKLIYGFSTIFVLGFFLLTYTSPDKLRPAGERRSVVLLLIRCGEYYKAERFIDKLIKDKVPLNNIEKDLIKTLHKKGYDEEAKRLFLKYIKDPSRYIKKSHVNKQF